MSGDNLEFEQPNWRGNIHPQEEHSTGLMLSPELIESLQPLEATLEGEKFVTGGMFLQGMKNLVTKYGHNGPFGADEVHKAINEVVQEEVNIACDGLVAKGLAEYDENGDIRFLA